MKDGYASLHSAADEQDAREQAVALAEKNTSGLAMTKSEKRLATKVDYVEQMN
jgi:hypothetical protein